MVVNKKKFFGTEFDKIISEKKRIKLGIYKSRQIIGLNDIINPLCYQSGKDNNLRLPIMGVWGHKKLIDIMEIITVKVGK